MTWWNRKTKPPEPYVVEAKGTPGEIIPCDNPKETVIVPPKDPPPNLSTKPKDVVGYCFGYVCPKKHVMQTFDNISIDRYKERRVCQTCGGISKPATVKRTSEPQWGDLSYRLAFSDSVINKGEWGWYNAYWSHIGKLLSTWAGDKDLLWTRHEFVHYLDTPKTRKK
jgi:hypothetical protein